MTFFLSLRPFGPPPSSEGGFGEQYDKLKFEQEGNMILKTTLLGKTYAFGSVKEVLAKANEEKTGDIKSYLRN